MLYAIMHKHCTWQFKIGQILFFLHEVLSTFLWIFSTNVLNFITTSVNNKYFIHVSWILNWEFNKSISTPEFRQKIRITLHQTLGDNVKVSLWNAYSENHKNILSKRYKVSLTLAMVTRSHLTWKYTFLNN